MSIISPELVIIVWHDLGDMINGQMKETVKDFKLTVFYRFFTIKFILTFIISFSPSFEVVEVVQKASSQASLQLSLIHI